MHQNWRLVKRCLSCQRLLQVKNFKGRSSRHSSSETKSGRERFELFDFPSLLTPSVGTEYFVTQLSTAYYRHRWETEYSHTGVLDAAEQGFLLIADAIAKDRIKTLENTLQENVLTQLRSRNNTLTEEERKLFVLRDDEIYWSFISKATCFWDRYKMDWKEPSPNPRKLFHVYTVVYAVRGYAELFDEYRGKAPSVRSLYKKHRNRILVANLTFSRPISIKGYKEAPGDWKVTLMNVFEPPEKGKVRYSQNVIPLFKG